MTENEISQAREIALHPTRCAICGTIDNTTEVYAANFDPNAFNARVFSARRLPDGVHYRMVRCRRCSLIRSDPVAERETLVELYSQSTFEYTDEVANLRHTYGRYVDLLAHFGGQKGALLEIGCGNGFFLQEALKRGYATVSGVEPGVSVVMAAEPQIRARIVCDIMRPGLFAENSFDVICLFQVLDHLPDPAAILDECLRVLRPGGLVLCLNHNVRAISARLLRERSPIVDIEHTYLYDPDTITQLFRAHGFRVLRVAPAYNTYSLYYLIRLIPLPLPFKSRLLAVLNTRCIGHLNLSIPLGNLYLIAQRPV